MFTEQESKLADDGAKLIGSIVAVIPGDATKKKEYLQLIAGRINTIAEVGSDTPEKPLKNISDNLTNTLHSIHDVLPESEDASKVRAKKRFKSSITILNGVLDMIGL